MDKIDKASMYTYLTSDEEAVEILVDMFNGDYSVEMFRNDANSYYEPDDRGDINR